MAKEKKGSFIGLIPVIVFLILYMATGILTSDFESMPLLVGIVIACMIGLALNRNESVGEKKTLEERVTIFCKGGGENTLILMVVIFIFAGAFYGVANAMGAVDSVTNLGLSLLPVNMILPGIFIIGCILSFSMGTSMGTIAALAPVAIDIAQKTDTNMALVCGIVVGGAMFGDNLSFISGTVIAATRTQDVSMKEKFKYNFIVLLPAMLLNIVFLFMYPIKDVSSLGGLGDYSLVSLLPYLIIIVLSVIGMNVLLVMLTGVMSGIIIGLFQGSFDIVGAFKVVHEGMLSMEDVAIIAIFVGGLVAVVEYLGGIDWLLYQLSKKTKTSVGGEFSIAALVILLCIATTNNTIAVVTTGPLAKNIGEKFKIPKAKIATILSISCCSFQGLLPHAGQLLVVGGLASISPVSIMPYVWYCLLMNVCLIGFIIFNIPKVKYTEEEKVKYEIAA